MKYLLLTRWLGGPEGRRARTSGERPAAAHVYWFV